MEEDSNGTGLGAGRRHAENASYKEVRLQKDDFLGCSRRSLLR